MVNAVLQSHSLTELARGRNNNLNLVRFIAAFAVLASHSYALCTGHAADEPLRGLLGTSLGGIAVDVFFFVSGFLVTGSLLRSADASDFLLARFLRIFPGLWIAILGTVLFLGPVISGLSVLQYFSSADVWKHLLRNCIMVFGAAYELPGVFGANPWPNAVNGSLWTLPYELRMYLLLVALWLVAMVTRTRAAFFFRGLCVVLGCAGIAYGVSGQLALGQSHALRLGSVFFVGSLYWIIKDYLRLSVLLLFAVSSVGVIAIGLGLVSFLTLHFLLMPYLVLCVAYLPSGPIANFNRVGDFSYGMYIYAFPVQQSLAHYLGAMTPTAMTLLTTVVVLPLAAISWFAVERHAIALRPRIKEAIASAVKRQSG